MKSRLYYFIIAFAFGFSACKKEVNEAGNKNSSLLKVMKVSSPYAARDVVEFPDGSVLVTGVMLLDEFVLGIITPATPLPALMAKYSADGVLQWQIELPEVVQVISHCILHSSGNIVVVGTNSKANPDFVGIAFISPFGEVLGQNSFFNSTSGITQYGTMPNTVDCAELPNGNIALAVPTAQSSVPLQVRLVVYNPSLAKIVDEFYKPDAVVLRRPHYQVGIKVDAAGDILINGADVGFTNDSVNYFAFALKINGSNFSPIYHQLFANATQASPSNFDVSTTGSMVWAASNSNPSDSALGPWFSLRMQEIYYVGPTVSVWKSDGISANTQLVNISGYPKYGYISKVIKCSQGGYALLGTCNINRDQRIPSEYQIMIIKVSEQLQVEWMKFPNTNSPSVAGDIIETETGFLVSATHLSLGEISSPILFKTDKNGIIK